jgi:hypothetical protein
LKSIYPVAIAVLLGILATWWFTRPESPASIVSLPASTDDVAAGRTTGGNADPPRRPDSTPPQPAPVGQVAHGIDASLPSISNQPATDSTQGSRESAPHAAVANGARPSRAASSTTPDVDKTKCEAAAETLAKSVTLYDLTPTWAIAYGSARAPPPNSPPSGFDVVKAKLSAPLCTGDIAYDPAYPVEMEFVAIGPEAYVRILVGDHWISDGTVLSVVDEEELASLKQPVLGRRARPGPHLKREAFDRQLARNPGALMGGL